MIYLPLLLATMHTCTFQVGRQTFEICNVCVRFWIPSVTYINQKSLWGYVLPYTWIIKTCSREKHSNAGNNATITLCQLRFCIIQRYNFSCFGMVKRHVIPRVYVFDLKKSIIVLMNWIF